MPICPKCRGESDELGAKCPRDEFYYIHESALEDAERDSWIGTLAADKYVIVALISEGGMGAVYQAIQLPVQREVAFKVLRAELKDSKQGKERFAREARAISRLSHPNIITMHDFGVDSLGHPFMAMEYAPGQSLADWMMTPGLTLQRISHVFRQILAAMSDAHEQGVVHRDLKPENLIVTRAGNDTDYVKLLDFGIARMVHDTASRGLTRDGEVFGTPHYMAPEQAQGKRDIGPQADVYALGIMFYEMLSGECPFDAPTPLSILYMQINDPLPELRPKNKMQVPQGLRDLIDIATAKDPAQRFENAGAMLNAMDHALGDMSGIYAIPAASREGQTPAPAAPAPQKVSVEKATELDLDASFDDAVLIAGARAASNQVQISDPSVATDMDLVAPGDDKKRLALILLLVLLLGGGFAVYIFGGSAEVEEPTGTLQAEEVAATPESPSEPETEPAAALAEEQAPEVVEKPPSDEVDLAQEEPRVGEPAPVELAATPAEDKPEDGDKTPAPKAAAQEPTPTAAAPTPTAKPKPAPQKFERKPIDSAQTSDSEPKKFAPAKFGAPAPKKESEPRKFEFK
ncbi:serine/threonine protein kinase [Bradymonas sediminis]|nr:serine/threonine-protein kinase [Bradymonas sediminis]TDP75831.1 serine/threonine protein kinase [Bradymonas sediminis]